MSSMVVFKKLPKAFFFIITASITVLLLIVACASPARHTATSTAVVETVPSPTSAWSALFEKTPYPYTTPLPPANSTVLDGTYVELDPIQGTRVPCRRCPPYPPEGGVWKLNLDKGIFRLYHEFTGWHTLGSFAILEDRIVLFNDPHCYETVGVYAWRVDEGQLVFEVIEDGCGTDLRTKRFTHLPWTSCQPPSAEAAISGHWPTPIGCDVQSVNEGE